MQSQLSLKLVNIAPNELFLMYQIMITMEVEYEMDSVMCKLWTQQCFIQLFGLFYWWLCTVTRVRW